MTKATKLDKEIQEGLYDPKGSSHLQKLNRMTALQKRLNTETMSNEERTKLTKELNLLGREMFGYKRPIERRYDPKKTVVPAHWYEAMVRGIKKSSDVRNPYAIVKSIWAKLSPSKKAELRRREAKGERFKYNLPLPVDKPTRGTGTVRMVKPFKLTEVAVKLSVPDYLTARASGLFQKMKREDGTTTLVARCKSPEKNVNVFVDKPGGK